LIFLTTRDLNKIVEIDGKMVNLSKINLVGFENECLMENSQLNALQQEDLGHWTSDSSVTGSFSVEYGQREGEFVSGAFEPLKLSQILEKCHPNFDGNHRNSVNDNTGGHVHVSLLSNADYQKIMTKEFYDHFIRKLTEFGHKNQIIEGSHFWKRIEGKSLLFKNPENIEQKQHKMTYHYDDDRYYHINYCFNVDNRHTVEFRILPMFRKASLQKKAVLEILKIIQEYLEDHPIQKPITLRLKI